MRKSAVVLILQKRELPQIKLQQLLQIRQRLATQKFGCASYAVAANTAKTGITSAQAVNYGKHWQNRDYLNQASAIVANTAKAGYTEIWLQQICSSANTAKTGITVKPGRLRQIQRRLELPQIRLQQLLQIRQRLV